MTLGPFKAFLWISLLGAATQVAAEDPTSNPLQRDEFRSKKAWFSVDPEMLLSLFIPCWNVGALSSEALSVSVTIGFSMTADGRPDRGSIHMVGFDGGSEAAAKQAYEAGRRAIIICGDKGFPLPSGKYEQWKDIEMVFDPKGMRLK